MTRDSRGRGPEDVLGGPDRSAHEDVLGEDWSEHEDVLGGPDESMHEDELGEDWSEHEDMLGGDAPGREDVLEDPEEL
jgi:hypothetical protein